MMQSLRRPFRLTIENYEVSKLHQIILRFAVHVRQLEFSSNNVVDITDFEYIMRPMINLVEMTFEELELDGNAVMIENISIVLPRLERMFLKICHINFEDILSRIEAKSLKEFTVLSDNWLFDFTKFFKCHKTIKHVTMTTKHLQLTHLRIIGNEIVFRRNVIKHQPNLKHLSFLLDDDPYFTWSDDYTRSNVNDEDFTLICSLAKLETLRLTIGKLLPDVVAEIANLQNLNELVLKVIGGSDTDYCIYTKHMLEFVHFQKTFRKLITIPLPKLESFPWSVKYCEFDEFFYDNDEFVDSYLRKINEFGYTNVFRSMALSSTRLK